MKYLITLFLILGCTSTTPSPKYHYRDDVRFKHTFYRNCRGKVNQYTVFFDTITYEITNVWCSNDNAAPDLLVNENDLSLNE